MKKKFFSGLTAPLAVAIIGGAGAFFTASASSKASFADKRGYHYIAEENLCQEEDVRCTTDITGVICTYGSVQLFGKPNDNNALPCNIPLQKPMD